jgi:hypothetical protein
MVRQLELKANITVEPVTIILNYSTNDQALDQAVPVPGA